MTTPSDPSEQTQSRSVSAVVVSFADARATFAAIRSLLTQSWPPCEILVVDNHPAAPIDDSELRALDPDGRVRLVHSGENLGYTAACNLAGAIATGEWLLFLNPDARADLGCMARLLEDAGPQTGVVGAQILLPDGRTNAGDNPLHITGVAWAGRCGEAREYGFARSVASVSGAALMARARAFREVGGMCERFFLYVDDTDLCWRMRLAGWDVLFCPEAVVWHDYSFHKDGGKWYWLERNRLWTVLSNYSGVTLLLLAPLLVVAEAMVVATALRDGWSAELLRAWRSLARSPGELAAWRRSVQQKRRVADSVVVRTMTGRYDSTLVASPLVRLANPLVEAYRRLVLALLGRLGR